MEHVFLSGHVLITISPYFPTDFIIGAWRCQTSARGVEISNFARFFPVPGQLGSAVKSSSQCTFQDTFHPDILMSPRSDVLMWGHLGVTLSFEKTLCIEDKSTIEFCP